MVFIAAGIAAAGPWSRSDVALLAGIVLALLGVTAYATQTKALSKWLIQGCVVLLGLRLDLAMLLRAAADGLALSIGTIVGAIVVGLLLGRLLRSGREVSTLVTAGTAICGGSAISAVGTAMGAGGASIAVATAAIFVLNAVGLWTLPPIGHALGLTPTQFGTWAGVALHDIASVGGAAKVYGAEAIDTANVVKLTRVLWIMPLALLARKFLRAAGGNAGAPPFPWFILLFVVASGVRTFLPQIAGGESAIKSVSGVGFQAALFCIGAGLSRATLKSVGWRALAHAVILWIVVAAGSLGVIVWMGNPATS